jgi:hypothetical protein
VTDEGLAHLKDCERLFRFNLGGTAVTGAGLVYFQGLQRHRAPPARRHEGDGRGAGALPGLQGLAYLNVAKAQVTANARAAFHAAVPGCKIDYDGGTIAPTK